MVIYELLNMYITAHKLFFKGCCHSIDFLTLLAKCRVTPKEVGKNRVHSIQPLHHASLRLAPMALPALYQYPEFVDLF